ncbi:MAG TPA: LacI family DNA-binding transcriptional regulator [Propionibacteriaceae bacterium]|nr:LacI family DNA-binding transcriptional regulator [Propionibacteriaceae bacterium]
MTTLKDIADHFALSESTVSRILNGKGRASEETRLRVRDYASRVGYRPNLTARNLRMQATGAIGVVVPDISNPWYATFYKHVDDFARAAGYRLVLFDTDEDADREGVVAAYLPMAQVDGLIVATSGSDAYSSLDDSNLRRVVFVDNEPATTADNEGNQRPVRFIGSDNVDAAVRLTQHLLDSGRTRIATVTGPLGESSARQRLDGFHQAMAAADLPVPENWVVETNFLYDDGYRAAVELLAGERPQAIIAQNNVLAYAAVRAAREAGLKVRKDIAVVCFDHIDVYGCMRPAITAMCQPIEALAELALNAVVSAVRGNPQPPERSILESVFVAGETA